MARNGCPDLSGFPWLISSSIYRMRQFIVLPPEGIPSSVLIASFTVLAVAIVIGLFSSRVADKKRFVLWVLLAEYLFLVICATVICRPPSPKHYLHLMPLWVYTDLLNSNHSEAVRDIVVNLLLFIPIGALLAGISPSLKWYWVLLIGVACSLSIEVLQYIFLRGVAQTDDVIHNTVSCLVGWGIAKGVMRKLKRK